MNGEEILRMFKDKPLTYQEKKLFVDRVEELNTMQNIGRFIHEDIYGIAGSTGCGKTTLFNMLTFPEESIQKVIISITEKDTKEVIIADLLYKLCGIATQNERFSYVSTLAKDTTAFLQKEETKSRERGVKIGKVIEGESKWAVLAKNRYNLGTIKEKLGRLLDAMTQKSKIILCIDEIDKEKKQDVIIILDSIKDILKSGSLLTFVALPQIMYVKYKEDRAGFFGEGNLENILKDVLVIEKMEDAYIEEMIGIRTKSFPEILPPEVKERVIEFADGNPREALLVCQNAILRKRIEASYRKKDFILNIEEIKREMIKFIQPKIDSLKLSHREDEILRDISDYREIQRARVIEIVLRKSGMPRSTLNKAISKLLEKGAMREIRVNTYEIDRRVGIYYRYYK